MTYTIGDQDLMPETSQTIRMSAVARRSLFWLGQENEIRQRMARHRREYDATEHRYIELMHYRGEDVVGFGLIVPKHPDDQYLPINLWDETP